MFPLDTIIVTECRLQVTLIVSRGNIWETSCAENIVMHLGVQ